MKTITTTALIAVLTASIGLSAAAPVFAQEASPRHNQMQHQDRGPGGHGGRHDGGGRMGGGGFLDLTNPDRVEISLVRLSQRIDLTAEQQPLFDAFKTAAMAAAEEFSGVLESVRPAAPAAGQTPVRPEVSEMLSNRIAVTTAQLAALKAVEPSASAFFDSLTDEQQAQLMPQRGSGQWGKGTMPAPGDEPAMMAPPAPPAPPTNG
jgi:hypothetical protein